MMIAFLHFSSSFFMSFRTATNQFYSMPSLVVSSKYCFLLPTFRQHRLECNSPSTLCPWSILVAFRYFLRHVEFNLGFVAVAFASGCFPLARPQLAISLAHQIKELFSDGDGHLPTFYSDWGPTGTQLSNSS